MNTRTKIQNLRILSLASTVIIMCYATTPLLANPGGEHAKHEHHVGGHEHHDKENHSHEHNFDATSFSVEEIMKAIKENEEKLISTITEKKLKDVHSIAFMIRDLARPLPIKVSNDKHARVEGNVKNISKLANRLTQSSEAGDQAGTELNLKKLSGVIKVLEGQIQDRN